MTELLGHAEIRAHIERLMVEASEPLQKGILLVLLDISNAIHAGTREIIENANITVALKTQVDQQGADLEAHVKEDVRRYAMVRGGYLVASIVVSVAVGLVIWGTTSLLSLVNRTDDRVDRNSDRLIVIESTIKHLQDMSATVDRRVSQLEQRAGVRQ